MVPSRSSLPALTAFARPGPGASRSPTSSLVFGHPTPSTSSAPARAGRPPVFPWASLPRDDACFCVPHGSRRDTGRPVIVPDGASEAGRRSPVARIVPRGRPRASQVTGVSTLHTCRSPTSRRSPGSSPYRPPGDAAFGRTETLRTGIITFSGLQPRGPHPRLPTHQPPHY
jgi:hypothetical protein